MARGRDEDSKGVTSVSAITVQHDTSTSVDAIRGYSSKERLKGAGPREGSLGRCRELTLLLGTLRRLLLLWR